MLGPSKRQQSEDENKVRGTSYYLDQLNQLYEEQSMKARRFEDLDEQERLSFMAKLLRILQDGDDVDVNTYLERSLAELKTVGDDVREAIRYLSSAELVIIENGKIRLTDLGKELLSEQ